MLDLHTHTHTSFDGAPEATVERQAAAALRAGITTLAITNHYELDLVEKGVVPPTDLQTEEEELLLARQTYRGKLRLLRGIELGQPCYDRQAANALLAARPYDIVLCSLHLLPDGTDFYDVKYDELTTEEIRALWETHLDGLLRIAREADLDVLTHICYPLRYFPADRREAITGFASKAKEQFEPILKALAARDAALEINTSCIRSAGFSEPDPGLELLRFFRELGGKWVTVGSDAHRPSDVGAQIQNAYQLAKAAGFTHLTGFQNREKYPIKLEELT